MNKAIYEHYAANPALVNALVNGLFEGNFWKGSIMSADREKALANANGRCQLCGHYDKEYLPLEVDFIVPLQDGGKEELSNMQILCTPCFIGKAEYLQEKRSREKQKEIELKRIEDFNRLTQTATWEKEETDESSDI